VSDFDVDNVREQTGVSEAMSLDIDDDKPVGGVGLNRGVPFGSRLRDADTVKS